MFSLHIRVCTYSYEYVSLRCVTGALSSLIAVQVYIYFSDEKFSFTITDLNFTVFNFRLFLGISLNIKPVELYNCLHCLQFTPNFD